jgi:hypothetical protein
MDYTAWRFWVDMGLLIIFAAQFVYTWWSNREKVSAKRFATLERQVSERLAIETHNGLQKEQDSKCAQHRERTDKVEGDTTRLKLEVRHLPSHKDISALSYTISELHGSIQHFAGRLEGLGRAVDLVNEFLISQGGKK